MCTRHLPAESFCHLLLMVYGDTDPEIQMIVDARKFFSRLLYDNWLFTVSEEHGKLIADTLRELLAIRCNFRHKLAEYLTGSLDHWQSVAKSVLVTVFAPSFTNDGPALVVAMKKISTSKFFHLIKVEVEKMLCWVRLLTYIASYHPYLLSIH